MPYCVPTSGWTLTPVPIDATHASDRPDTAEWLTSVFHGLLAGKIVQPELVGRGAAVVTGDGGFAAGAAVVAVVGTADVELDVLDVEPVVLVLVLPVTFSSERSTDS